MTNTASDIFFRLFLLAVLIGISMFLSMSEISLASARKMKLQVMKEKGDERAGKVLEIQETSGNFLQWCRLASMQWQYLEVL